MITNIGINIELQLKKKKPNTKPGIPFAFSGDHEYSIGPMIVSKPYPTA
jgi:hypothetical protein